MRYSLMATLMALICIAGKIETVYADDYVFDPAMLGNDASSVDISLFNQNVQLPGVYLVDIVVGREVVDSKNVAFHLQQDKNGKPFLQPCITANQLARYGVKVEEYPNLIANSDIKEAASGEGKAAQSCVNLSAIADASFDFDFYQQRLTLNIPQIALRPKVKGIASEVLWNDGIPAFLLNYRASVYRTQNNGLWGQNSENRNLQLEPRLNIGAWRLKNMTTWRQLSEHSGQWQSVYTYAERGLNGIKSRLTLGERSTSADVFDSVPFRGVMLASDENMVPYNQRVFAPVIRGIARTNAYVEVKQNGYILYTMNVSPGPFAITDLPSVSGGDLQVTIMEADGSQQTFIVPYSTPVIALRQGYLKYNIMLGQYNASENSASHKNAVGQITAMYGLPENMTIFGGLQGAKHFQATAVGLGVMLGDFGAVSIDSTLSQGQKRGDKEKRGQMWRVRYSKTFENTNTSLSASYNQYSSAHYMTLSAVANTYGDNDGLCWDGHCTYFDDQQYRSRASLQLNQGVGNWGSFTFSGSRDRYWNNTNNTYTYNIGYNISLSDISINLNWSENRYHGRKNRISSVWLTLPLDRWFNTNTNTSVSYQYTQSDDHQNSHTVNLNGNAFDNRLNWYASQRMQTGNEGIDNDSSDLRLNWYGSYWQLGGGYSYQRYQQQMDANISGGVLIHPHGITFSQTLGDTVGLVEAPGADNVTVIGMPGVKTDFRGYTAVSYLPAYQESRVSLDAATLPVYADVARTDINVIPTSGAVIPVRFDTRVGARAMIYLTQKSGKRVPFGSLVSLIGSPNAGTGIVGDDGNVYLSGLPSQGHLNVQWGNNLSIHCQVDYRLPKNSNIAGVYVLNGSCQ